MQSMIGYSKSISYNNINLAIYPRIYVRINVLQNY